jgi:hypothetical protein
MIFKTERFDERGALSDPFIDPLSRNNGLPSRVIELVYKALGFIRKLCLSDLLIVFGIHVEPRGCIADDAILTRLSLSGRVNATQERRGQMAFCKRLSGIIKSAAA